ncbi:MAG TPA: hypothetical protein VGR30_04220 [Candidatus Binatia bacterium]|jgi:hypothetical protein|nr:hypothetical protein [Candidatus Binatia bacterium]
MIRLQIVERNEANLFRTLIRAMRSGDLRTFVAAKRGKRITHRNPNYPGSINCSHSGGVISCEIVSPRSPGSEWRLLSALIGRLADKFADSVHTISIQFPDARSAPKRRVKRRRSR